MVQGKKGVERGRLSATIDLATVARLDSYVESTMIPKSRVINQALIDYLDKNYPLDTEE